MNRVFDVFLGRPRLVAAIVIAALIAGILSGLSLPVAFFPTVARPTISVSCSYPGANSLEVMNTVAGPLEDRVNGVEGFDHMTSSCTDTGAYSLTVYFQADYDRDLALMKVQAAVQQALTQLPQEVKNTGVTVGIGQTIDLGYVTCYSERGELTRDEVVDYVFGVVSPAIMRVRGVGASSVQDEKLAIRIWLDADRMAAQGIGTEEVVAAVKAQNVQASLGTVGSSPVGDANCRVISLVAKGRLHTADEFGGIVVRTSGNGGLVYLRDIARIELGHEGYAHSGLFGDKPACVLHMYQLPGANTLETVAKVKELLKGLEKRFPGDLRWDMTVDVSRYSASALSGALLAFLLAVAIAFVVLLAVFRSLKCALVPVFAAVVSLSLVLTVLAAFGFFVTVLSLYALTAALVFMIGLPAAVLSACRKGRLDATQVHVLTAGTVVSLFSLVLMLVGGVQGLILRQFAVVFAAAGVATAFVAGAVVPALSRLVLPAGRVLPDPAVSGRSSFLPAPVAGAVAAALLLGAFALIARMPSDLVPNEDFGVVLVDVKTKDGTSRPKVAETMRTVLRKMSAVCDVEKSCTVFGEGIFSPSGENVAKAYLVLKPWSERGPGESTLECVARMRAAVSDIPEAQVSLMTLPTVPGMGSAAYVSPLVLSTADNDPVRLASEAHRLQAILRQSPLADDVTCGYNTDSPHLRIRVDRAKCELMKVPLSSLFATLQHNLGSIYVNDVNLGTQVNRVTVMSDWKGRSAPEAMAGLYVRSSTGAMVPVAALVEYEEELGPNAVYRYNRYLYCTVDMAQKAGVSLQDAMDDISRVFERELPRDYDTGWSGIAYEESSSPGRVELMISLSLLAVFLVLMVRFESWRRAALSLLPASAAVFGGVLALCVTGVPLSLYSRFALLVLVVITVSFALFASEGDSWLKRASLPLLAAAMMVPLAFTSGAGAAGSRSFGVALVGGFLFFALVGLPLADSLGKAVIRGRTAFSLGGAPLVAIAALCCALQAVAAEDDDAARLQREIDALPLGTLRIPAGEYRIVRTLQVTNNCSLLLDKGAILRAAAEMPYVVRIDGDKAKSDRNCFVSGGQIDGDGYASCAYVSNFAHYTMRDVTFLNGRKYGLHVVGGYELIANNLYFKCTKNGMAGNAGLFVQGGDSHYTDCVAVDYTVGFRIQGGANRLTRCHTWGGPVPPAKKGELPEMLKDSINFWIDTGCSTILRDCYADSGKIGFLVDGWGDGDTRLLGCSYFNNKIFGLDDITVIKHVHGRLLVTDGSITKSAPHMKVYEGNCPVVWQNMLYSGFGKDDDCPGAILRGSSDPASLKLAGE